MDCRPHPVRLPRRPADPSPGRGQGSSRAIVRIIFDEYVDKNIVAKAIAVQLNQRGHRTQFGKPWNHKAVLTVLRNRTYLGEIYFRGRWHRGVERPFHSAIVDEDTFAGCSRRAARRWRTTT